ncbi:hypothetical protein BH09BAC1_BH09BAC1_05070 [soil metagenome]
MARTAAQVYDSMIVEKNNQPTLSGLQPAIDNEQTLLNDLSSPSKVAYWRLLLYVVAVAISVTETMWDVFKSNVEDIIAKFRPGTLRWYQEMGFGWQYGHQLVYQNGKYQYAVIDEAAKLVKRCSVTEPNGVVRIKVATLAGSNLQPLTAPQLAALQAYFNKIKYPGRLQCVSFSADLMKVGLTVKYDPLVDLPTLTLAVEAAINNYLIEISVVDFDGRFNTNTLIDRIQKVTGVTDPVNIAIEAKYGALPYQAVVDEYQTNAGYAVIDTANFPLSNTRTYVPYV